MSTSANNGTDTATELLDAKAAIRPFLDILRDGSSANMNLSTVRSLAIKTFAHPEIFCGFDEFKSLCSSFLSPQGDTSSSPSGNQTSSLFHSLDLFSYGTLEDYRRNHQSNNEYYLPLNEQSLTKLGQLTALSCIQDACFGGKTSISYDELATALESTGNVRAVEDILVRCLYANVLKGKLCQKTRSFSWYGESLPVVSSRDVPPSQIPKLLSALEELGQRLENSGIDLSLAQDNVSQELKGTTEYWESVQRQRKALLDKNASKGTGFNSGSNTGEGPSSLASRVLGSAIGAAGSEVSHGSSLQRSSKRSRGGLAGKFVTDAAGYRM